MACMTEVVVEGSFGALELPATRPREILAGTIDEVRNHANP